MRGAYILSGWRFELIQLTERSVWRPRVNYNILPEDCLFRPEMALRSGFSLSSFGFLTHFVRVDDPLRSRFIPSSFRGFEQEIGKVRAVLEGLYVHVFSILTF